MLAVVGRRDRWAVRLPVSRNSAVSVSVLWLCETTQQIVSLHCVTADGLRGLPRKACTEQRRVASARDTPPRHSAAFKMDRLAALAVRRVDRGAWRRRASASTKPNCRRVSVWRSHTGMHVVECPRRRRSSRSDLVSTTHPFPPRKFCVTISTTAMIEPAGAIPARSAISVR